ncbi:hypothetical protein NE236_26515 [Actinoallomurus purpureus]|uniref:hypothetical protein n=1 Tax=Actinoallomurus purpureus TaxID=478114 RepID=UPI00209384C0|nr:hypothetical protein [Actinoallomurus purpureus]MCO6008531.1 hypothetical protein [Actinoallomurus purpureus]
MRKRSPCGSPGARVGARATPSLHAPLRYAWVAAYAFRRYSTYRMAALSATFTNGFSLPEVMFLYGTAGVPFTIADLTFGTAERLGELRPAQAALVVIYRLSRRQLQHYGRTGNMPSCGHGRFGWPPRT